MSRPTFSPSHRVALGAFKAADSEMGFLTWPKPLHGSGPRGDPYMWPAHARILPLEPTGLLQMGTLPGQFRMTLAGRPGGALFRGPSPTITGCGCERDLGLVQQQESRAGHVERPDLTHFHSHSPA